MYLVFYRDKWSNGPCTHAEWFGRNGVLGATDSEGEAFLTTQGKLRRKKKMEAFQGWTVRL